ncbi:hypothetical protein T4D_12632 [Trichinella pseudospiralis]|uniref:Uncharacterized protein n=1 Tax=Trichinella pseudospiralis TaxID=6337 RepID=A0A0V1EEP5_TRIPS|nr:hypothetical protein T4D_12632 [Trichinella pseudospiralis]
MKNNTRIYINAEKKKEERNNIITTLKEQFQAVSLIEHSRCFSSIISLLVSVLRSSHQKATCQLLW